MSRLNLHTIGAGSR